jgi:micrococcal nuclease
VTRRSLRAVLGVAFVCALLLARSLLGGSDDGGDSGSASARVTRVTDGDTVRLEGLGRVRLIGIDTPEVFGEPECYGPQASAFARRMLPIGTRVTYRLGLEREDRYGRALAYVYLPDGRMLNELLAARGYATQLTISPNDAFADRFAAAVRRARERRLGLWAACPVRGGSGR